MLPMERPSLWLYHRHMLADGTITALTGADVEALLVSQCRAGCRSPMRSQEAKDDACRMLGCLPVHLDGERKCYVVENEEGDAELFHLPLLFTEVHGAREQVTGAHLLVIEARAEGGVEAQVHGAWLLVVSGGAEAQDIALAAAGAVGAIRSDFEAQFEVDSVPLGTGASSDVFIGAERASTEGSKRRKALDEWSSDEDEFEAPRTKKLVAAKMMNNRGSRTVRPEALAAGAQDPHRSFADRKCLPASLAREVTMLVNVMGHPNVTRLTGLFWVGGADEGGASMSTRDGSADNPPLGPHAQAEQRDAQGMGAGETEDGPNDLPPRWCVVLEYCRGGDLFDAVRRRPLSEMRSHLIIKGLLGATAHIHQRGVMHRDIKVENVLLMKDGTPVLGDFGISCFIHDENEMSRRLGSPGYAAPEVYRRSGYNEKADLFGIGVVQFYIMSGLLPFAGSNVTYTIRKTLHKEINFRSYGSFSMVSEECKSFLALLLMKSPSMRLSAAEALEDPWIVGAPRARMPRAFSQSAVLPNGYVEDQPELLNRPSFERPRAQRGDQQQQLQVAAAPIQAVQLAAPGNAVQPPPEADGAAGLPRGDELQVQAPLQPEGSSREEPTEAARDPRPAADAGQPAPSPVLPANSRPWEPRVTEAASFAESSDASTAMNRANVEDSPTNGENRGSITGRFGRRFRCPRAVDAAEAPNERPAGQAPLEPIQGEDAQNLQDSILDRGPEMID